MYKHKIVQGLHDLLETYGGRGLDPMMKGLWIGFRGQVPYILNMLDNNEEAIAEIEKKLREVLEIPPVEVGSAELEIKVAPEEKPSPKKKKKPEK